MSTYPESDPQYLSEAVSHGGGFIPNFFLPPLAVLLMGALMTFLLLGDANIVAEASSLEQVADTPSISSEAFDTLDARLEISPVFTAEVDAWGSSILRWANEYELDPNMVATVMQIESCGDPLATSVAGAVGLFQVMPFHFEVDENPYLPDTNALRGMSYLFRSLQAAGGDPRLAFAGYNGGIGVIDRPESAWASETVRYAYWGSGIYADSLSGGDVSPRLDEWLIAGGESLCRQAASRLGIDP